MPGGNPKAQTIATKRYEKKAGWVSKSYKLKKEVVDEYAEACKKAGVSAAGQLTKMMKEFIEEVNNGSRIKVAYITGSLARKNIVLQKKVALDI